MKRLVCYFLSLSLTLFSPLAFSKVKVKEPSLQLHQYVLSSKQIQMLKPQEQIRYLSYLTSLVYLVEAAQFRANQIIPSYYTKSANLEIPEIKMQEIQSKSLWAQVFKDFARHVNEWILPQAHGLIPALILIGRGAMFLAPKLWQAGRPILQKGFTKMKDFVIKKAPAAKPRVEPTFGGAAGGSGGGALVVQGAESAATSGGALAVRGTTELATKGTAVIQRPWVPEITKKFDLFGGLKYYAGKYPITTAVTAGTLGYEIAGYMDDGGEKEASEAAAAGEGDEDSRDSAMRAEQTRIERQRALAGINPEKYKETGGTCLYAGHISTYQADSNGQFWCNRPKNIIQEGKCPGVEMKARTRMMVQCNSFGITNDANLADEIKVAAQKDTCIPLYNDDGVTGINDLSKRCGDAVFKWLEKTLPQLLHSGQYDEFAQKMRDILTQFEKSAATNVKEGSPAVTFEEYCANGNFINKNYQKAECEAISGVLTAMKEKLNLSQVVAQQDGTAGAQGQGGKSSGSGKKAN